MKKAKIEQIYKDCSSKFTELTQEIHQFILGTGNFNADVLFLGDIPTAEEEEFNMPFVGRAGKALDSCLESLGLEREDVYITHILKYRPYKVHDISGRITNRAPKQEEIEYFLPYLQEEIEIISPKIIVTLGSMPLRVIMEDDKLQISKEHGKIRTKYIGNKAYKILPFDNEPINEETGVIIKKLIEYTNEEKEEQTYNIAPKKVTEKPTKSETKSSKLKAIIIYGGDGYADDPTLVAIDRISHVLVELNTSITRIDLHKNDYEIQEFFKELSEAQAVIIGVTVEWIGIGGYLQHFLDKCWKYGNKQYFDNVYLFGVVISRQHYERDTYNHLIKSWELLGGVEGSSLLANIKKSVDLETNTDLLNAIDKKTEEFYRIINQNRTILPTSIRKNKLLVEVPGGLELEYNNIYLEQTPENNNSTIPDYQEYIEKQQQDIADIANLIKQKVNSKENNYTKTVVDIFNSCFIPNQEAVNTTIQWMISDKENESFIMDLKSEKANIYYGITTDYNTIINLNQEALQKIIEGKITIQRAFMTGEIKVKGEFDVLYKLDGMFELN